MPRENDTRRGDDARRGNEARPENDAGRGRGLSRRTYLRRAVALGAAGVVGASAPAAAQTTSSRMADISEEYETVIDVVEAGADDTGEESITPVLDRHAGDDTLLVFPPGTYRMNEEFRHTGFVNFGLVGDDATIVPGDYFEFEEVERRLFRMGVYHTPGRDLRFEGFTIDQSAPDTGIRTIEAQVSDGLVVRDISIEGVHDSGTWGPGLFDVMDPKGSGLVERFRAPDGAEWVSNTPNDGNLWRGPTGIMVSRYHEGTVELRDCELGGFPDNGVYAGNAKGTVVVKGGVYRNSHASSLRIGGRRSRVDGATVVVDENPEHFTNQRAIRLDQGSWLQVLNATIRLEKPNGNAISVLDGTRSARIADTSIQILGDEVNQGIVVGDLAGSTYVQRTDIEISGGGNAIEIKGEGSPGEVGVTDVTITGDASGETFRNAIRCERNGCEFRGVTIDQPGSNYRRALEINADDCLVYRGSYKSTHHPIIVNGSGAWIQDVYADSYDRFAAIRLNDTSSDVRLKDNTLVGGVLDKGCEGLVETGTET